MEWYEIFSIIFSILYTVGVLTLVYISTERGKRKAIELHEYVLIKLDRHMYGLVRQEDYLPAHSLIIQSKIIKVYCNTAKEAIDKVVKNKLAKADDIYNATGEEV